MPRRLLISIIQLVINVVYLPIFRISRPSIFLSLRLFSAERPVKSSHMVPITSLRYAHGDPQYLAALVSIPKGEAIVLQGSLVAGKITDHPIIVTSFHLHGHRLEC